MCCLLLCIYQRLLKLLLLYLLFLVPGRRRRFPCVLGRPPTCTFWTCWTFLAWLLLALVASASPAARLARPAGPPPAAPRRPRPRVSSGPLFTRSARARLPLATLPPAPGRPSAGGGSRPAAAPAPPPVCRARRPPAPAPARRVRVCRRGRQGRWPPLISLRATNRARCAARGRHEERAAGLRAHGHMGTWAWRRRQRRRAGQQRPVPRAERSGGPKGGGRGPTGPPTPEQGGRC